MDDVSMLVNCPLFSGLTVEHVETVLGELETTTREYAKGQTIIEEGDRADKIGIIIRGKVQIFQDDFYGNRTIIGRFGAPHMFGEAFACAEIEEMPVSVGALENDTRIMFIKREGIFKKSYLVHNMLKMVARRNLMLNQKLRHISHKTTRDRIMNYLLDQAKENGSDSFTIPFDRQGLADYLGVERSAMSTEISKLVKDGVIETNRSYFKLLDCNY